MAEPMFQEVEPKLRELCRGDVEKQITLWRSAYAPYIRAVRLKEHAYRDDPLIRAMRDPDDVPTVQLYLFLLPEFLFSDDRKHLGDFPISQEIGPVSTAYRDIIVIRRGMQAASTIPLLGIAASSELWKAFRWLPPVVQIIMGGTAVGAFFFFRKPLTQKISETMKQPGTRKMFAEISELVARKMDQFSLANAYIQEHLSVASLPMRVLDHLIEILTVVDEPPSLDDIFYYLLARGYQPKGTSSISKYYVLSLLKKYAFFSGSSWRLMKMDVLQVPTSCI